MLKNINIDSHGVFDNFNHLSNVASPPLSRYEMKAFPIAFFEVCPVHQNGN